MLKFSVIVPVYCASKFLDKCISSITKQTYDKFELILVDDGSRDDSLEKCKHYSALDSRITVIHQENKGVVSARHVGVSIARGEYLVFVDSDDYIEENLLAVFYGIIERHNPDVVICDYYEDDSKRITIVQSNIKEGLYDKKKIEKDLFPSLMISSSGKEFPKALWAKAFRTKLYKNYQLVNSDIKMGEDAATVIPIIFNCNSLYKTSLPMYFYRIYSGSVTNSKRVFPYEGPLQRFMHVEKNINLNNFDFREQCYRMLVLSVYTVISSRYNDSKITVSIDKEVTNYLDTKIVKEALSKCRFDILKFNLWFRVLVLKYKILTCFHICRTLKRYRHRG